jgi:hypothetical protein
MGMKIDWNNVWEDVIAWGLTVVLIGGIIALITRFTRGIRTRKIELTVFRGNINSPDKSSDEQSNTSLESLFLKKNPPYDCWYIRVIYPPAKACSPDFRI